MIIDDSLMRKGLPDSGFRIYYLKGEESPTGTKLA